MADGRIDGHFVINQGGITHGIAEELGLSASDCKKMGSIWNEVINELNNDENYTIENNGNNNGLTVQVGAVVKFSQDCWQRIVDLVNKTLDKNIKTEKPAPNSYEEIPQQDQFNTRDARKLDISGLNLSKEQLLGLTIDETTVLSDEQMEILKPVMENMKDPGLNIRSLHERGITGNGVRIAIIDGAINPNHQEFSDRVIANENFTSAREGTYHGNVVSSVAVGKECGVAPDSELAFYAASTCEEQANAIERIIQQNEEFKANGEPIISVISISCGFDTCSDYETNYQMLRDTINKANSNGITVITCDPNYEYANFGTADRNPEANPNETSSYRANRFYTDGEKWIYGTDDSQKQQTVFIPADHRTIASEDNDYRYEGNFGGSSWTAPYIAGVFALAKQVKPDITYEQFQQVMQETANDMYQEYDGESVYMGKLINPEAIINAISV